MSNFTETINISFKNILNDAANGKFPVTYVNRQAIEFAQRESNLVEDGVSISLGQDRNLSSNPRERNVTTLSPKASVLIKKKAFSTFKGNNDLQWLDKTEKMLLRATKSLFAYKVTQIRAYESLTKIESFFQESSEISLNLLVELFNNAQFLNAEPENFVNENLPGIIRSFQRLSGYAADVIKEYNYEGIKEDILLILERNAFASDIDLTTWIVDPNDTENYGTGPGTGVIELGIFSDFSTNTSLNTEPSSASISLEDPYRILFITEGDIEIAIEEALVGTLGILKALGDTSTPVDTRSIVASGLEVLGLGGFDNDIDVDYIRDRLRTFYLGRPIINPGDGVHFYIRGNKTTEFFRNVEPFDRNFLSIDESILEAERILFTNKKIDLETYKRLRQFSDNSFGMRHVFGGFVKETSESWNNGSWTVKVDCTDNMGWLRWSRFMKEPALQDAQGILEDPLTPYVIKKDPLGRVLPNPELIEENKQLINNGLLTFDSGILNGQYATEQNLLQGQYNQSGSISGAKILQHPHGLVYRWKEGIFTATNSLSVVDPIQEDATTLKQNAQKYGLQVAEDVLNNLDIANILSILIVGQPYNVETFINQAYLVMNIKEKSGEVNQTDPLAAVLNVVRRQNTNFGNFRPYRMITLSDQTLLQSADNSILRNETNTKVRQLRSRLNKLDILIDKLKQERTGRNSNGTAQRIAAVSNSNDLIIRTLEAERESIQKGIQEQIDTLRNSGPITSTDLLTQNFNLFGRSKTLPLSGNAREDHQTTRAMTLVGAQRRIEDVRLNRDKNLFIVSDQYDEHTDLRPFLFKLRDSNYKIFKGSFVYTYDKCEEAANFLNLEFFCNSQGHLEFRPPQWNRTPLSILERLFEISRRTSKKIVPDFLTEVFQNRTASLRREIHALNIKIVILCLLLNRYPDRSIIPNFSVSISVAKLSGKDDIPPDLKIGKASLKFFGVDIENFSDSSGYSVDISPAKKIVDLVDPLRKVGVKTDKSLFIKVKLGQDGDHIDGDTETILGNFDPVFQETSNIVNNVLNVAIKSSAIQPIELATTENLIKLRESFTKLIGIDPVADLVPRNENFKDTDFIFNSEEENPEVDNIVKAEKYLKKLEEAISSRDSLVTILQRNKAKQDELDEVEGILSGEFTAGRVNIADRIGNLTKTISSIFTGDATKGSLFDHLVEDDRRHLLGPGSGRRFIIEEADIISCSFTENEPRYCRIDFTGDAPITGDTYRQAFEDTFFWAGAVDFDLWRQYGYKDGGYKAIPFSNDAENISKPYAITDLQLQRLMINRGSITVAGNEYYEPGDVVYIKSKQLLYYVRSVDHNFNWGSSFTTSLTLEYGHPPGTYLPSPLDIIGQQFTKQPLQGNILTYRNMEGDDSYRVLQPYSSLIFPVGRDISEFGLQEILSYKDNAIRFYTMMVELNSLLIGAANRVVLIRGFVFKGSEEEKQEVIKNISYAKTLILNPVMLTSEKTGLAEDISALRSRGLSGMGVQIGNKKSLMPLTLPNGQIIQPIPKGKIAEQIVYINKGGNTDEVRTFNPSIQTTQTIDGFDVTINDYLSSFPKGGPKQRTWLDIKNNGNITGISFNLDPTALKASSVIEIGVLDVDRQIKANLRG